MHVLSCLEANQHPAWTASSFSDTAQKISSKQMTQSLWKARHFSLGANMTSGELITIPLWSPARIAGFSEWNVATMWARSTRENKYIMFAKHDTNTRLQPGTPLQVFKTLSSLHVNNPLLKSSNQVVTFSALHC